MTDRFLILNSTELGHCFFFFFLVKVLQNMPYLFSFQFTSDPQDPHVFVLYLSM